MADLFDAIDDPRRERLRERGWAETTLGGQPAWLSPEGERLCESEAFLRLERLEREEGGDGA